MFEHPKSQAKKLTSNTKGFKVSFLTKMLSADHADGLYRAERAKINFGRSFAPGPNGGAFSVPPDSLAGGRGLGGSLPLPNNLTSASALQAWLLPLRNTPFPLKK